MDPGRFDTRAQVLRRPVIRDGDGEDTGARGAYVPVFTVWAGFRPQSVREAAQGGVAHNVESGTLIVRDSAQARSITNGDRVLLKGRDFAIDGVGLPDRQYGTIILNLSSNLGGE